MTGKRIVLAEWHWIGHHPIFFAYFVLALEQLGAEVLAICPKPDEARETVTTLRRDRGLDAASGARTIFREVALKFRRFNHGPLRRPSSIDWSFRHFLSIEAMAKKWQADSGEKVDLIFYACMHEWDFDAFHAVQPFLSIPWSGLYLHALSIRMPGKKTHTGRLPRPDRIFRGPLCRAVGTFDEGITEQLATVTGKPVIVFPDLADERLPLHPSENLLGRRVKEFARGRPVVGLCGYLIKSKGVVPLALVSQRPEMAQACFALAGEMVWNTFSPAEVELICAALTNGQNTWSHLMRIPSEEQLNSFLSACDILYAAYLDFSSSSNILAKAALLKKPVIVSEGHLMADRVRHYRMGEIVPQGDVDALVRVITGISGNPAKWISENQPRWSDYIREHSFERLKEAFGELMLKS